MTNNGYVTISREIRESSIWKDEKEFSKLQAWLDIVMDARFSNDPIELEIKGRKILCHKGECIRSINTWGKRWHWTKLRVQRFIDELVKEKMIRTSNEVVAIRISVLDSRILRQHEKEIKVNQKAADTVQDTVFDTVKYSEYKEKDASLDTVFDTTRDTEQNDTVFDTVCNTVLDTVKLSESMKEVRVGDTVSDTVSDTVHNNIIIKKENKEYLSKENMLQVSDSRDMKSKAEEMLALVDLARKFHEVQFKAYPNHMKQLSDKDHEIGAQELERLIRIDGWDLETQIKPALRFCLTDEFWKPNLKKLSNLRKKSHTNEQTKFANVFDAYERSKKFKDPLKKDEWQPVEKFYEIHDPNHEIYGSNIKKKVWTPEEVAEIKRQTLLGTQPAMP